MDKLKLFLENFIIYGFGGIISKLIPLIMIPVITRLMPNSSYYGISDMSNTVVSFGSALAVMGMYDAMYRMFFDNEDIEYKKCVCSTAFFFTVTTSIILFVSMIFMKNIIAEYFFGNRYYEYLVYITAISTLLGATNSIVSAPTRMQNKRKIYLIMNSIIPLFSYSLAVVLLLKGRYIIALPLAGMISSFFGESIFLWLNRSWFSFKKIDFVYLKPLLLIGVPLLPNFLVYWIFNSSDKLMITNLLGTSFTGIYSVGTKLGHISQLIYMAFAGGWQYFAFSTMKEKNQVENNSLIFEYLGVISFACSLFVFALSKTIFELLFTQEYLSGFIVSPYLFLAPLLQMLFQVACNQFLIIKKTWPNFFVLSIGAIINIILNLILIPFIGIEGAAISTLLGYFVSDIVVVVVLSRMHLIIIPLRFIISVFVLLVYIFIWRFFIMTSVFFSLLLAFFAFIVYIKLYYEDLKKFMLILKEAY